MYTLTEFDPNAPASFSFDTGLGSQASEQQLYVWNVSNAALKFTLSPARVAFIPPMCGYPIGRRPFPMPSIAWAIDYLLSAVAGTVSRVTVEVYEANEPMPSQQPIPLSFLTNLGNAVSALSTKIPVNTAGGTLAVIEFGPDTHSPFDDWEFRVTSPAGDFQLWDFKNGREIWRGVFLDGSTEVVGPLKLDGRVTSVGGQATDATNALGVAPFVADSGIVTVAVTTLVTVLTFSIPTHGRYRLSPSLLIGNGTAGNKPTFKAAYTNGAGAADSTFFYGEDVSGTGNVRALNGTNVTLPAANNNLAIAAETLEMNTGTLTVTYQTTGTPNDRVSVLVERVA